MHVSTTSHGFKFHLSSTCRGHLTSAKPPLIDELKRTIRDVKDFPKPGIVFKDVTPVLLDVELFRRADCARAWGRAGPDPQAGEAPRRDPARGLRARVRDRRPGNAS